MKTQSIWDILLKKGIGILKINVFVAKSTTTLKQITIPDDFIPGRIDLTVLSDIQSIRGLRKYKQLKKILSAGGYGISIYNHSELAAYGWVGINESDMKKRIFTTFSIPPYSAHIFECYTIEKFRGKNLYPMIVNQLVEWCKSQNIDYVYIDSVYDNNSALKGINKLGFNFISRQVKVLLFNNVLFEYDFKR